MLFGIVFTCNFVLSCSANSYFSNINIRLAYTYRYRPKHETHLKYEVYDVMSKGDLHQKLNMVNEITLGIKGRKSGKDIPRPVWFVHEGNTLYLLSVQGYDTNWYKDMLVDPMLKISANG